MKTGFKEDLKNDLKKLIVVSKEYEKTMIEFHKRYMNEQDVLNAISEDAEIMQLSDEWKMIYTRIEKEI